MNLKLSNELRRSSFTLMQRRKSSYLKKEERRRTGRYIAILVGICLFLLAIYHAWVRKIPIVASLVVPALIMFVYVGWVLYTASRDKHKLLDLEAAMQAALDEENDPASCGSSRHNDLSLLSSTSSSKVGTPEANRQRLHSPQHEQNTIADNNHPATPIILVNDKLPEELDQKLNHAVQMVVASEKFNGFQTRTKFKRKFCRSRRQAVFKRSYSIA